MSILYDLKRIMSIDGNFAKKFTLEYITPE